MNTAIYIFGKFANNRYLQYPLDYTKTYLCTMKNFDLVFTIDDIDEKNN